MNDLAMAKYGMPVRELAFLTGKEVAMLLDLLPEEMRLLPSGLPVVKLKATEVRELLIRLGFVYPSLKLSVMNLKGGVGKTTTAVSIASRAVQYGVKTCLLDMDAQGSASLALGVIPDEDDPVFNDVWQNPGEMVPKALRQLDDSFYLLPSGLENSLLDVSLMNPVSQKKAVKGVCDVLSSMGFDLVIVDCPPSLGAAVISSSCAADMVLIPVASDAFSFRGVKLTVEEIKTIRETFGLGEIKFRVLATMVDRRQKLCESSMEKLKQTYGEYLMSGTIRTSTDYSKALEKRETVFASARKSHAREDYDIVVRNLLNFEKYFEPVKESDHGEQPGDGSERGNHQEEAATIRAAE